MSAKNKKLSIDARAIVAALCQHKGQHIPMSWQRDMKTRKEVSAHVTKRTDGFVRAGIDYANLKAVQSGIASGERGEVQPLPTWQEWAEFPFILRHKGNGTEYVRLYPATFNNLRPTVHYFIDGVEVSEDEVKPLCLASEFREREDAPLCFSLKADSVLSIG